MLGWTPFSLGVVFAILSAALLVYSFFQPEKPAQTQAVTEAAKTQEPAPANVVSVRLGGLEPEDEGKVGAITVILPEQETRAEGRFVVKDGAAMLLQNDAAILEIANRTRTGDLLWNLQFDGDPWQRVSIWHGKDTQKPKEPA